MSDDQRRGAGLALVGPRGTGKTTVGRLVAQRLGLEFADTDVLIETASRCTIREIFAQWGEPRFRDLEQQVLEQCTRRPPGVLSCGGGIILRESNRAALRRYGTVVWLTADPAVLADRLQADPRTLVDRPALTPAGTLAELANVMAARAPLYEAVADARVDTSVRPVAEVVEAVMNAYRARNPGQAAGAGAEA